MTGHDPGGAPVAQEALFEAGPSRSALLDQGAEGALQAVVERITFPPSASGWTVLKIRYDDGKIAAAVGSMLDPVVGAPVALHGEWTDHPKYGRQFRFDSYLPRLPEDAEGAKAYLSSARIRGIGKTLAADIVDYFGDQTLCVLDDDIGRLIEVPGIGPKKLQAITEGWAESAKQRLIAIALAEVGASTTLASPIWEAFGSDGAALIKSNPYALTSAKGVGFGTCDAIAQVLGWERDDPRRIAAGLAHTIETAEGDGHCYLPVGDLAERASTLLGVKAQAALDAVARAVEEERIVVDAGRVYTARMHYLETDLAEHLQRLAGAPVRPPTGAQAEAVEALLAQQGLTGQQAEAVRSVLDGPVTVLTGGPGVGKTHTVKTVAAVAEACRWRVALCAPTGRAARRMEEMTGGAHTASTVHRLIGLGAGEGGQARFGPEAPMPVDLVVCDESSMLDVSLARHLVRAVGSGTRLLLVGDVDQLPSVGPGSVLRDVIASGAAGATALTEIFRQGPDSGIVQVAHTVNAGQLPDFTGWTDLHFWAVRTPEEAADGTVEMVCDRIPAAFDVDPRDIQVLAAQRRGSTGTIALNARLQDRLNPGTGVEYDASGGAGRIVYRPGDRVMVVQNNYDKGPVIGEAAIGVFNGTPARVVAVEPDPGGDDDAVTIETDEGHTIGYKAAEVGQLALAYAITIHKSQGSQYECAVIPVTMQSYTMLQRNLLYTAITRASQRVVLVGNPRAVAKAVRTNKAIRRSTGLAARLAGT